MMSKFCRCLNMSALWRFWPWSLGEICSSSSHIVHSVLDGFWPTYHEKSLVYRFSSLCLSHVWHRSLISCGGNYLTLPSQVGLRQCYVAHGRDDLFLTEKLTCHSHSFCLSWVLSPSGDVHSGHLSLLSNCSAAFNWNWLCSLWAAAVFALQTTCTKQGRW